MRCISMGALVAGFVLMGCSEERAPGEPMEEAASSVAEAAPREGALAEEELPPLAGEDALGGEAPEEEARSVDSLSEGELEAECFQGRQEACDRLGH